MAFSTPTLGTSHLIQPSKNASDFNMDRLLVENVKELILDFLLFKPGVQPPANWQKEWNWNQSKAF